MMGDEMKDGVCGCPHHKMAGGLVVLFGLLFLLGNLDYVSMDLVNLGWPVLVIVAGGMKLFKCKCC